MHDLTVVGLSEDGQRLVLVDASGEEFAVVVDERLREALRPFPTRPPAAPVAPGRTPRPERRTETSMDSVLRPRDIQTRIRAGESPETVAEAARTTVDGIMAFAGPVLAERAHVAQLAQKASVRRRGGDGARVLGEAAEQFLAEHGLHEDDLEWDAWRRPDGRWALVALFALDGRPARAEFSHDLPGRYVVAENDDARVLTGELPAPGHEAAAPVAPRRLSTVRFGDEVPLGDDAIEMVRDPRPGAPLSDDETDGTTEETVELSGLREAPAPEDETPTDPAPVAVDAPAEPTRTPGPTDMDPLPFDPAADTADADWLVALDSPGRPAEADAPAEPATDTDADTAAEPDPVPAHEHVPASPAEDPQQDALPGTEDLAPAEDAPAPAKPAAKRRSRSSVPSWDEIMFGGGASGTKGD